MRSFLVFWFRCFLIGHICDYNAFPVLVSETLVPYPIELGFAHIYPIGNVIPYAQLWHFTFHELKMKSRGRS